jgi:hypothetical protein
MWLTAGDLYSESQGRRVFEIDCEIVKITRAQLATPGASDRRKAGRRCICALKNGQPLPKPLAIGATISTPSPTSCGGLVREVALDRPEDHALR